MSGQAAETAVVDFATMMALEAHGPDTFIGAGPRYPWGGLYGGQIVAQALRAAASSVDAAYRVHSLHAFFLRRGDHDHPIRFEVDRLRDGRSFVTRAVVARQAVGAILNLSASFQIDEDATDVQATVRPSIDAPDVVGPPIGAPEIHAPEIHAPHSEPPDGERPGSEALGGPTGQGPWSPMFDRRWVETTERGRAVAWMRMTDDLGEDPVLAACAVAFCSDDLACDAVARLHPDNEGAWTDESWVNASLDHAIWFHRPVRADAWLAWDLRCERLVGSRGLALGEAWSADGTHVATVAQEVLLRPRRPRGAPSGGSAGRG